jgi:hypothetical protein
MTIDELCNLLSKVADDYAKTASYGGAGYEWAARAQTGVLMARKFLLDLRDREDLRRQRKDGTFTFPGPMVEESEEVPS